ncbi:hypothetical protein BC777_3900 [Yoonia maricola]|uniref:DUF4340 domain-containing protein n=1 Tax=Yoonia maricola TaxID=420999 RepID=A0A2M8W0A8_9RHOB|nr:hypothetical protein [Yoonia maricola]PJI84358.1 hypothetical protein BC777_3900 [Yoonia maricola]
MRQHANWLGRFFCVLFGLMVAGTMGQAQPQGEKFELIAVEPTVTFDLSGETMDFSTAAPERFIWNDSNDVPRDFIEFGLFDAFEEIRIGYDPLERDRYEVRLYRARVAPERLAVAAEYATLFARSWGKTNFGVTAHNPRFGEVLGGDDTSGVMKINRISVFRRGEELLVLRQRFDAERFETYSEDIARMVGSIRFETGTDPRPFDTALQATTLPAAETLEFTSQFPPHWNRVLGPIDQGSQGVFDFWVDGADRLGNVAAMLASIPAPQGWTSAPEETPSYDDVANSAAGLARLALENLAPDTPFQLHPVEATNFAFLRPLTHFNALYTFRAEQAEGEPMLKVNVLHTIGLDGRVLATVMLSAAPSEPYLLGTSMHANYVQAMQIEALHSYYSAVPKE